jgi:hypothetical protein
MITKRFLAASLASLLAAISISSAALAQAADPNAPQQQPPPSYQPPSDPQVQQQPYPPQGYPQQPPSQQPPYPQQGYPQQQQPYPPQGYPQQPGYPPPPQGYPPQQGYPQQQPDPPPAGYPPPGYPQQPPYPPAAYQPPPPTQHHGLLLMGYLGFQSFQGSTGDGLSPGLRLGGLLGFYASPVLSLNGELTLDVLNLDSSRYGSNTTGVRFVLSLSPLYHIPTTGNFELVIGPKFGVWGTSITADNGNGDEISASGYLFGLNAGGFAHVGNVFLGGLFSFEAAVPTEVCFTPAGFSRSCSSPMDSTADKVIAFNVAVLL